MYKLLTKSDRHEARQSFIAHLKGRTGDFNNQLVYDVEICTYTANGVFYGCLFIGTSGKPAEHYRFRSAEHRQQTIDNWINNAEARIAHRNRLQLERNNFRPSLKEGEILYSSWGYDQTNIDFYQVLRVFKCFVEVAEIASRITEKETGNSMAAYVEPLPGQIVGKPMHKKVLKGDCIRISRHLAYKWDGREKYCSWYA